METGEFSGKAAAPVKKSGKGALIAAAFFALVAVGLGVWIAILLPQVGKNDDKCKNSGSTEVATTDNDEKIRDLVKEAEKEYPQIMDGYGTYRSFDDGVQISVGDGVIMPTNRSYGLGNYSMVDAYYSLAKSRKATVKSKMEVIFDKYGLKRTSAPKGFWSWDLTDDDYGFYEGNDIVCYMNVGYGFDLDCADKNWVKEEDKNLVLALADAYEAKTGNKVGYLDAKAKDVTKNSEGTYERITAMFADAAALFYRKADGDWKYFTGTQQMISCDSYDTDELKAAYVGERCWQGNNDNLTVK